MEDIIQRISDIYNDCWKSYKQYLEDNNMAAYNKRSKKLMEDVYKRQGYFLGAAEQMVSEKEKKEERCVYNWWYYCGFSNIKYYIWK